MTGPERTALLARALSASATGEELTRRVRHHGADPVALWSLARHRAEHPEAGEPFDLPVLHEALTAVVDAAPDDVWTLLAAHSRTLAASEDDDDADLGTPLFPGWTVELHQLAARLPPPATAPEGPVRAGLDLLALIRGDALAHPATTGPALAHAHLADTLDPELTGLPADPAPRHRALAMAVGPAAFEQHLRRALSTVPLALPLPVLAPVLAGLPLEDLAALLMRTSVADQSEEALDSCLAGRSVQDLSALADAVAEARPDWAERAARVAILSHRDPSLASHLTLASWRARPPWDGQDRVRAALAALPPMQRDAVLDRCADDDRSLCFLDLCPHRLPTALATLPRLADRPPVAHTVVAHGLSGVVVPHLDALAKAHDRSRDAAVRSVLSRAVLEGLARLAQAGDDLPDGADHLLTAQLDAAEPQPEALFRLELLPRLVTVIRALPAARAEALILAECDPSRPHPARGLVLLSHRPTPALLDALADSLAFDGTALRPDAAWVRDALHRLGDRAAAPLQRALSEAVDPEATRALLADTAPAVVLDPLLAALTQPESAVQRLVRHARAHALAHPEAPTVRAWVAGHPTQPVALDADAQPRLFATWGAHLGTALDPATGVWVDAAAGTPQRPVAVDLPLDLFFPPDEAAGDALSAMRHHLEVLPVRLGAPPLPGEPRGEDVLGVVGPADARHVVRPCGTGRARATPVPRRSR